MQVQSATFDPILIPEEERPQARTRETYPDLVRRLSHQSVVKHFDAYADIAWDSEEFRIDPDDPRWQLPASDPLGATHWYRSQPAAVRSRLGLHYFASLMKIGLQFEGVLKRGLLELAADLPNGSPEFRYAYHEVIEEAQHSLMFQEFVNRTGFDIPGMPKPQQLGSRVVVRFGRTFPELFFMFVLGGEDPIDHMQRSLLQNEIPVHPLLRRIMQIHVTEEARHLCFARNFLKQRVPHLSARRRFLLSVRTPLLLSQMARLMMRPSQQIIRTYAIPKAVVDEAYNRNPEYRAATVEALGKVRNLCGELGLLTSFSKKVWQALGIWAPLEAR
ncbi:MAG: diiron oxygenase [Deltaproteobacteria bacterium]|nr:diiron oxygenase [Deltaproteobacteria bacterium]